MNLQVSQPVLVAVHLNSRACLSLSTLGSPTQIKRRIIRDLIWAPRGLSTLHQSSQKLLHIRLPCFNPFLLSRWNPRPTPPPICLPKPPDTQFKQRPLLHKTTVILTLRYLSNISHGNRHRKSNKMGVQKNMPQRKEREDILEKNPNETEIK